MPFELRNVARDPRAREEFLQTGFLLPPVVVINGVALQGFQPARMEELLLSAEEAPGEASESGR